jgi:hypothetical protein
MSNTAKTLTIAALIVGISLVVRHEMNTARGDFDFSLTTDWSDGEHQDRWEPVVADEVPEQVSMDDVFKAAIAPRSTRTASAATVIR